MKRIFSGIQPSGVLHLGNYIGAIKQFVELQDKVDPSTSSGQVTNIFCVVDLHAITVPQDPKELQKNILSVAAMYIACGIDPEKSTIFVQSDRPEHSELAVILNCFTKMGELQRMTQFKDKIGEEKYRISDEVIKKIRERLGPIDNIGGETEFETRCREITKDILEYSESSAKQRAGVGLFDYPVLMAADILLYQTTDVPVGDDQKQHLEITRNIAERVNNKYQSDLFVVPNPLIKKEGSRIMGLDDPKTKMSKSAASALNYIALTDDAETIKNKIKKAVTDSGSEIKSGTDKPALTNLLTIYSEISGKSISEIEKDFEGKGYGDFKDALAEALIRFLSPIQEKYNTLMADPESLRQILSDGAKRIEPIAQKTLSEVKSKIGLG